MKTLTTVELRYFLGVQAICLFLAILFVVSRSVLLPISNNIVFLQWLFCMTVLAFLLVGVVLQALVRKNVERNLLRILGLYGFITVIMVPLLFLQ